MNNSCDNSYCHRCRGMIWSFLGILLVLNAFIWPKWLGVDGWMAFLGIILMFVGVWNAFIQGCSCNKELPRPEPHKEVHTHTEIHVEKPVESFNLPPVHHSPPPVRQLNAPKKPAKSKPKAKKGKR